MIKVYGWGVLKVFSSSIKPILRIQATASERLSVAVPCIAATEKEVKAHENIEEAAVYT